MLISNSKNMAKYISFQNSNLYLLGAGTDTNGNKVIKLQIGANKPFSIQTNGNLTKTHDLVRGKKSIKDFEKLTLSELEQIEKEAVSYLKKHGSVSQKTKIKSF